MVYFESRSKCMLYICYTIFWSVYFRFNTFDNHLFGINNSEAERMDPQQKLLIECTYKALEDAGVPVEAVSGTKTGVFVGKMKISQ